MLSIGLVILLLTGINIGLLNLQLVLRPITQVRDGLAMVSP